MTDPPQGDPKPTRPPEEEPGKPGPPKEEPPAPHPPAQEPPPGQDVPPKVEATALPAPGGGQGPQHPIETQPGTPGSDEEELQAAAQTELQLLKEAARFATPDRIRNVIEALLFAAEKPLDLQMIVESTQFTEEQVEAALLSLQVRYAGTGASGVQLYEASGKYQLRTDPEVGAYVRRMLQVKPMRLTRAAMETLSIIAYRQPITRPEMEDLRGVDCGAVTKALLERKLIRILGKKDEPGRPLLYGTTKEFLELFNLRDLTQLPTLREFQELSEESRKIVEEETPAAAATPLSALQVDTATAERMAKAAAESDSALDQLEKAITSADETVKTASAVLNPPVPPEPQHQPEPETPPKP